MSELRENLQRALCQYIRDTLSHIKTVRGFYERLSTWTDARKTELRKMRKVTGQQELAAVLKDTPGGLEELDCFLDAVEKLAVTSLHVFTVENLVLHLPEGISPEHVQGVITAARMICPLLLEFKRDTSFFFLPKLQNVEVLSYQLNKYILTTKKICKTLKKRAFSDFCLEMNNETLVDLDVDLSEDEMQSMLCHINQLQNIRVYQPFRMVFLFQEVSCSGFISEFSNRRTGMLHSLEDLEQCAVQLDRMNKGAMISSVAGSSVGLVGGVLSFAGLALMPVTAGLFLGLMIASGVNSVVTTATEIAVNKAFRNKANKSFQSFREDVQSIQDCLEEVSYQPVLNIELKVEYLKVIPNLVADSMSVVSAVSNINSLIKGKPLCNVSGVLSVIQDIGQAAGKRSNALFIGMDIIVIVKDSISLAEGSETKVSQRIRARAALWRSEMKSWQKICDFLCEGLESFEEVKALLDAPFYPERKIKKRMCCVIL